MAFILEVILTGWIDPLLWYKSMSALYIQKNKKRCFGAFIIHCVLLIFKQLITNATQNSFIQVALMVGIQVYLIIVTAFLFEGRLRDKLISIFVFFCILSAAELLVIKCYALIVHINVESILQDRMINLICGILVLLLKCVVCYCFFGSIKAKQFCYLNKEKIILCVLIGVMLFCILSRKFIYTTQSDTSVLLDAVWLLFLWNVFSFVTALKKKDNYISDLHQNINQIREQSELVKDIERFKYSYSINMLVMKNLFYNQQYDELGEYMEEAFADVEKAVLLYNHSNLAIRILISRFMQITSEMRIPFHARILVKKFGMDDEDICSILHNLITNGLEAAAKVPCNLAFVSLQVLLREDGYEIICSNACKGKADFAKTSKQDKQNHGFGVGIVDKIAKKYSAVVTRECLETECEGIGRVKISIHMFDSGSGDNQI